MSTRRIVVLSDLHLGPENYRSTFRDEEPLAALLHYLADSGPTPEELVLAGDLFDFLQVDGYGGFNAGRSAERFQNLLRSPRTARVIGALRKLAAKPGLDLTVLAGNHDPELLVPEVRESLEEVLDRRGSVFWADDVPLRPREMDRPPVWGRTVGEPGREVWIVHGDRWDPLNFVDREGVREAILHDRPVALPVGSHLVFEVLHPLKENYDWIDNLKPEPAVFLLLLYLDAARMFQFLKRHTGITTRLLRGQIEAQLRLGPVFAPASPRQDSAYDLPGQVASSVAEALASEPQENREFLLAELDSLLRGRPAPAVGTLAGHGGVLRRLLRAGLERLRTANRFQELTVPDNLAETAAPFIPEEGVVALVAGHTHGPRLRPELKPSYVNTGTWLPVGHIPEGDLQPLIDRLDEGQPWPAEAPRTFAEIETDSGPPRVRLFACDAAGRPRELIAETGG